ncbi:hypothetical protein H072_8633 [Dactylellina haptotyla CBS 200.50]|uniref:Derlin n=1 Tax=Dactylellina haptotyla (strain CBS 200.50) TaxID=1284197 RepID=S8BQW1_DACHA|nr:hypothetical protein H072_8633 [Dactylellina haptotyla CBS 200.50]
MASPADAVTNVLNATPPVTKFYAGLTFLLSLSTHVLGLVPINKIIWHQIFITSRMPPQLWRIFSSFFLTGPQLNLLFDTFMIYQYGKDLESIHFNTSGDFLFYLVFNGIIILLINTFFLGGMIFCQTLGVAMAYSWGQRNRGRNVNFFFVGIKAQWLAWAIIGITAIQAPGAAFILTSGIVSAHLYEFLTVIWPRFGGGSNLLPTPSWFKFSFEGGPGTSSGGVGGTRAYGTGFDPRSRGAPAPRQAQGMFGGSDTGRSSGTNAGQPTAAAWRNRGTGHRLGSD